jgi:PAS domain S-box-containing protein
MTKRQLYINSFVKENIWNYKKMSKRTVPESFLFAFLVTAFAVLFKVYVLPDTTDQLPYLLLFAVVMVSACFGGHRCALYAAILTFIATVVLLFFPPAVPQVLLRSHLLASGIFFIESLMITGMVYHIQLMQKRMYKSEIKFRGIVEKAGEGFFMLDREGKVIYSTHSIQPILGYAEDDFNDKELGDFLHPEDLDGFRLALMKLVLHKGEIKKWQCRIRTQGKEWIWTELTVSNLLEDAAIRALVVHFNNVTDRVVKEKQQEDFVHMATHELKSPVTVLKGYLQLLVSRIEKEGASKDYLAMLTKMNLQLDKLLSLIGDMLDSTRIKAGELNHHFSIFNINLCVKECIEATKASFPQHRVTCELVEPNPLLRGDKDRIGQVINNFITNAIKYSPGKLDIKISTVREGGFVKVIVKDEGIGIPEAKLKQVFDRFYRVDTLPKDTFQGLGLGLFIASEIIKVHQGYIGVDSEEGLGSEFWFKLPLESYRLG